MRGSRNGSQEFDAEGAFVEKAYRDLVEWQIAEGSAGLVPCGTTGEAATLTKEEQFAIVRVCVDQARGRVPVLAGAGFAVRSVELDAIEAAGGSLRCCVGEVF